MSTTSESSLPVAPKETFASSPPTLGNKRTHADMVDNSGSKSAPVIGQQNHKSQLPLPTSSAESHAPPSAQRVEEKGKGRAPLSPNSENDENAGDDADDVDDESDPAEEIAAFDWDGLEARYHDAMKQCQDQEAELSQEFVHLMQVGECSWLDLKASRLTKGLVLPRMGELRSRARD